MALLFVYGTLLAGEANHALIAQARFVGSCATRACFELFDLGEYPALVANGSSAIPGELYDVDAETLCRVDELEGHPELYQRVSIELDDGRTVETYVMPRERARGGRTIASWLASRSRGG